MATRPTTSRARRRPRSTEIPASDAIREQPPSDFTSATAYFSSRRSLTSLQHAADGCRACDLWLTARRTVFGRGPRTASLMLIGEQPGNEEDKAGLPFVGPSGHLLDEALEAAGIDRSTVYVTNAVKHFKWDRAVTVTRIATGDPDDEGRRIHKSPSRAEIRTCGPWLGVEMQLVHPRVIACLGATAAQAILGPAFRVTQHRGTPVPAPAHVLELYGERPSPQIVATVHPSSILRIPSRTDRDRARRDFFSDIAKVARLL